MDTILWINACLVLPDRLLPDGYLLTRGGTILAMGQMPPPHTDTSVRDVDGAYLCPGFIDTHIHGGAGFDFMDGTEEAFRGIAGYHSRHGVTSMLVTTLSGSTEETLRALETFERYAPGVEECHLLGVHLEGPYFSQNQRGAQDPRYICSPDQAQADRFLEHTCIRRWSMAPELPGAFNLAEKLAARGILVSAAHTDADFDTVQEAAAHGFSLMTHLYSGMSGVHFTNGRRIAGAVEAGLCLDQLCAELIADGCHLPGGLLRLAYKCKGPDRLLLTSDAMRGAGLPEGTVTRLGSLENGQPVRIGGGVAHTMDGTAFAGSVASADRLLRTMVGETGIPLWEAVGMLTRNPARLLGLSDRKGGLQPGMDADLVILDEQLQIQTVVVGGRLIEGEATQ